MPTSYGNWNPNTPNAKAAGKTHDAAVRLFEKMFNLATDSDAAGGTSNVLHVGRVREGSKVLFFTINSSANLSGITFNIGTAAVPAKYATGVTGPNAATVLAHALASAQDDEPLTAPEDIILTPSGALAASGTITVRTFASHR